MVKKTYTIDKVLMKLFQKFPGLDGVQGLMLVNIGQTTTQKPPRRAPSRQPQRSEEAEAGFARCSGGVWGSAPLKRRISR